MVLVTCQRGELRFDDLGGIITAIIDQHGARQESIRLAERVVSGQRLKASQGRRIGGKTFGYDREIRDESGQVVRVVNHRETFCKPPAWTSRNVPACEPGVAEAVRQAFEMTIEGHNFSQVAREFNRRGFRTRDDHSFKIQNVKVMLTNPVYAGVLRAGASRRGQFCHFADEGIIEVADAHEAIVTPRVFAEVQRVLQQRTYSHQRSGPGTYLLSGLLTCLNCGQRMTGVKRKKTSRRQQRSPLQQRFYQCQQPACASPVVERERLEAFVLKAVGESLAQRRLATPLQTGIARRLDQETVPHAEERQLREFRSKISRATENLALADNPIEYRSISRLISRWRDEETAMIERNERRRRAHMPQREALEIFDRFVGDPAQWELADRVRLQRALNGAIGLLQLGVRMTKCGSIAYREIHGELRLADWLAGDETHPICDEDVGYRKIWRDVVEFVCAAKKPVHLADVQRQFAFSDNSLASFHLRRAVRSGLIRKLPSSGGWVPV